MMKSERSKEGGKGLESLIAKFESCKSTMNCNHSKRSVSSSVDSTKPSRFDKGNQRDD